MTDRPDHKNSSDEVLAACYLAGDPTAANELAARYCPRIQQWAIRLGLSSCADDLSQDTIFRLLRSLSRFDSQKIPLSKWVQVLFQRTRIDLYRKKKNEHKFSSGPDMNQFPAGPPNETPDADDPVLCSIREYLNQLKQPDRSLFEARHCQDTPTDYDTLASLHGITAESARKKVSRCLKELKAKLLPTTF